MARRRIESRQGIAGVRVLDSDTGQGQVAQGIGVLAAQGAEFAFEGLGRQRVAQATTAARNAELQRDARGNLIAAPKVGSTEYPSIYSEHYNSLLQKRFLSELGSQASIKLAEYHNRFPEDPEGFRIAAEAYSEEALANVDDDSYEVAKSFINTTASQHYTNIAQARAERTWKESRGIAADNMEAFTNEIFQNAATGDPNDPAMLDQHAQLMSLAEAELFFMEDALGFDTVVTNKLRDNIQVVTALGRIQADARPLFDNLTEVADVDAMVAQATLAAKESLPTELVRLMGGQEAALKAIDATISIAGMTQKTKLHVRDRAEINLFNNVVRDMQAASALAINEQEAAPLIMALARGDVEAFRNPNFRAQIMTMRSQGITMAHTIEQLYSTEGNRTLRLERAGAVAAEQVRQVAARVGVPLKVGDDGMLTHDFPPAMYRTPEGIETVNHKLGQLLAALDLSSGSGDDEVDPLMTHLMLVNGLIQDKSEDLGFSEEDQRRANAGEPDAVNAQLKVWDYVRKSISKHTGWGKPARESMDNLVDAPALADAISQETGEEVTADAFLDQKHNFDMLVRASPAATERVISTYQNMGLISEGAKDFMETVGNQLTVGSEPVAPQNLAIAMRIYGALRENPEAMEAMYGATSPLRTGFERLWERGVRGEYRGDEGYHLKGASSAQAQALFGGQFETDNAASLSAAGLDPKTNSLAGFTAQLEQRLQAGPLARNMRAPFLDTAQRNIGYGPELIPRVQQAALAMSAGNKNFNDRTFLNDLVDTNFEALGYGTTSLVQTEWSRGRDRWLVYNPPSAVILNDDARRNPQNLERRVRKALTAEFQARYPKGTVKPEQVYITGIQELAVPYTNPEGDTGHVRTDRTMIGLAYYRDDQGMDHPLLDEDGYVERVNINQRMEAAMQDHLSEINEWSTRMNMMWDERLMGTMP